LGAIGLALLASEDAPIQRHVPLFDVLNGGGSFLGPLAAGPLRYQQLFDFPPGQPRSELFWRFSIYSGRDPKPKSCTNRDWSIVGG
jgi:hypothetical protein